MVKDGQTLKYWTFQNQGLNFKGALSIHWTVGVPPQWPSIMYYWRQGFFKTDGSVVWKWFCTDWKILTINHNHAMKISSSMLYFMQENLHLIKQKSFLLNYSNGHLAIFWKWSEWEMYIYRNSVYIQWHWFNQTFSYVFYLKQLHMESRWSKLKLFF